MVDMDWNKCFHACFAKNFLKPTQNILLQRSVLGVQKIHQRAKICLKLLIFLLALLRIRLLLLVFHLTMHSIHFDGLLIF